jgi:MSHA pilin protein MshC
MIPFHGAGPMRTRASPPARALAHGAGYTLIELIIVLSVTGVLAATLGPRFFTQSVFSQRGYADELASALRATQKAAVITGCPARLTLSSAAYAATQQAASANTCNPSDATWSTAVVAPDGSAIQNSAPSGTTANPTGVYLFDDQGRLTSSPGTTITVGSRTVSIVAGTGYVQVQ